MSRLKDMLAAKAAAAGKHTPVSTPPAEQTAPATKPSFASAFKKAIATEKAQAATAQTAALSAGIENKYVPPASAPIEDFQNLEINLTTDVTQWPDNTQTNYPANQQGQLQSYLDNIRTTLVTDDVSDALNRCMTFLHENPDMKDLLLPEDVGLLVQALSQSAAVVVAKKNENKAVAKVRTKKVEDALSDLTELGF